MLHHLENWAVTATGHTAYLPTLERFLDQIASRTKKVAALHREKEPLSSAYKRKLKDSYVDTFCTLFDGMLGVAMAPDEPDNGRRQSRVAIVHKTNKDMVRSSPIICNQPVAAGWRGLTNEQETRLLLTLAHFDHLKRNMLPGMITKTAKLYETEMFRDQTMLTEIIDQMDGRIFGELVKRKSDPLAKVMREGILDSGIDWLNTGKPTGTYFHESETLLDPVPHLIVRRHETMQADQKKYGRTCTEQSYCW